MRKFPDSREFVSCPGSRIHEHFTPVFDGRMTVLKKSGESDIQQEINAHAKYCDLHFMLHRLSVGDYSVLSNRQALYGDFSGMPSNPIDAINLVRNAESRFGELDAETRATFDNDWRGWLASMLSGAVDGNSTVQVPTGSPEPENVKE